MAPQVSTSVQRDVLVFDWWVRNVDRLAGNPNLLWDPEQESLVVIDHNQALESIFDASEFMREHVFSAQWPRLAGDMAILADYARRLTEALPAASVALESAPGEWLWENSEFDVPARFDRVSALALLSRCATDELWRTV